MRPLRLAAVRDYLEALLVAVLLATFARTFVVQAFRIPTSSMEENLLVGDHLLVNKFVFAPAATPFERRFLPIREIRRGDVVVFRFPPDPGRDFIKRCVGIPGDRVRIRNKELFVNGEPVGEPWAVHRDERTYPDSPFLDDFYRRRDNFGPFVVPPGHLFVLGDNRDLSNDSRFWGPVPRGYVKGRPVLVYWSVDAVAERSETPVDLPRTTLGGEGGIRWHRIFRPVR